MSSSEIKNRIVGLAYVVRTSRNPELVEDARQQIVSIYKSIDVTKKSLLDFAESHLAELPPSNTRGRSRSGASDIADMLEEEVTSHDMIRNLIMYIVFIFSIAMYISLINNSLHNLASRKN